jgi:hypothetical protein
VYIDDKLGRFPAHLFMYLVLTSNKMGKQKWDSTGSRTREPLFKFKYKITMRLSSNKGGMPWLTFPFESSSMTYPFGFENS